MIYILDIHYDFRVEHHIRYIYLHSATVNLIRCYIRYYSPRPFVSYLSSLTHDIDRTLFIFQYVAVLWHSKWVRGIIQMQSSSRIWLIYYGISIRLDWKSKCVKLPSQYKSLPSKVFEASIHGVTPLEAVSKHFHLPSP